MVFPPIPPYLDPSQWQQQQQTNHHHQSGASGASSFQLLPHHPSPPPPPPQATHVGGGGGSIRPGSMVDRARMGGLPMPESALKCPRCESTNTKFCYFNNYSLTQPRHFCKTCRRYWTRGGALRSVPVGGGYRRNNKRSKNSSKSPVNSQRQLTADADTSNVETQIASSKINSPLHHQVSAGDHHDHRMSLNYSNLNNYSAMSVPNNGGGDLNYPNFPGFDQIQWRLQLQLQQTQQPPLYASTGETSSSYNNNNNMNQIQQKMEENGGEVKMGRQFLGVSGNDNHHYWSGFSPSYSHT